MPVFPVNHLPEVFPLFQDTLVRFLEGRVEDRPQHNHVAGEVQIIIAMKAPIVL